MVSEEDLLNRSL